jgi:hypothetical protein
MNLLVKSPVWDDLREIGLRIAAENPGAADRFLTAARESFELLRRATHVLDACAASQSLEWAPR